MTGEVEQHQPSSNDEYAASANRGDSAAAARYLQDNLQYLTSMARWLAANTMDHDDLVAECIAKLLALWKQGKGPTAHPNSYVIASMRNRLIDERRSPRSKVLRLADVEDQLPPEELASRRVDLHREFGFVRDALASLPEDQQRVLKATVIDGRKPAELTEELARSASAIYSLNHRAKTSLRRATLQQVLMDGAPDECRHAAARLPDSIANSPDDVADTRATAHQQSCERCRAAWARFSSMSTLGVLVLLVVGRAVLDPSTAQAVENDLASRTRRSLSQRNRAVLVGAAGTAIIAAVGLWAALSPIGGAEPPSAESTLGQLASPTAIPEVGENLRVPSVGLDVPIRLVSEVDGTITPPGIDAVYLVSNRGVGLDRADQGTIYLAMHSLPGARNAPGNALVDVPNGRAALEDGAHIDVGTRRYEVTRTEIVDIDELPTRADVWLNSPGRLVIITSLQREDGARPTENVVITAKLLK